MSLTVASSISLFDQHGPAPLESAVEWLTGTLLGSVATTLCVIAIAIVGMTMLSGRFSVRQGLRVVLGCFVLLGAPIIAGAFSGVWQESAAPPPLPPVAAAAPDPRADLPPADYDPYAGASLRRD